MKAIIDGKRYNTQTATKVAYCGTTAFSHSDFRHEETYLYRTARGSWFVAGNGGPLSRWARSCGNGYSGGSGIKPVSEEQAREELERHHEVEALEKYFGDSLADA